MELRIGDPRVFALSFKNLKQDLKSGYTKHPLPIENCKNEFIFKTERFN